jgi:hypothetical protein
MNYPPLILCSSLSTLLPFLAILIVLKYASNHKPLFILFTLSVAGEAILYYLNSQHKPSAWFFHIYTFVEYMLIAIILTAWQGSPRSGRLIRMSSAFYILVFALVKTTGLEDFETASYNTITRPLAVLIIGVFALYSLRDLWLTSANLTSNYRFWILLSLALYSSTSLVISSFMFAKEIRLLEAMFEIHAVVHIAHNILFTIGIFVLRGTRARNLSPDQYPDYSSA